jgi:hypothetical protein
MKTALTAASLVFSASMALAAYMVDVEGGDRVTVDTVWEEDGKIYLKRGAVSLSIAKDKIRSIEKLPDPPPPPSRREAGVSRPEPALPADPVTRAELEQRDDTISRHLLRTQRERVEAESRGEPPRRLLRLAKEIERTQQRRLDVLRQLERLAPAE